MRTLNDLVTHINKHKDAVIIIGGGINPNKPTYPIEKFNEEYNRKNLKRNPSIMWQFFMNYINVPKNSCKSYDYIKRIPNSLILDQNTNGDIAAQFLHGHINLFKCTKCKTIYSTEGLKTENEEYIMTCELCDNDLRPTVLLSGERYDQVLFDNFKEKLLNTHTLILIGMDYNEESLLNLIADFGDMKSQLNAEGNPENTRMIVSIQSKEEDFNPNEIAFCEFLVKDDIEKSLKKLVEKI